MTKLLCIIPLLVSLMTPIDSVYTEPQLIRCTCYTASEGSITASGKSVNETIVAGKDEWLGYICLIYENNDGQVGNLIGIYEFADTGGELISSGKRIDVYRDTLDRCYEWVAEYGDYVYIQIISPVKEDKDDYTS